MLLALPMIPPARMNEYLQLLESEIEHLGSPSAQAFGHDVLAYIRNHYIEGSFGNEHDGWEWNVFDRLEDGHLTNNPCEGGNNRLRKRVGVDHPGFYRLCGTLVNEFDNVRSRAILFEAGNLFGRKNVRTLRKDKTRAKLKELLQKQQISLRKYAISQGQLNAAIKEKKTTTGRRVDVGVSQADLRGEILASTFL